MKSEVLAMIPARGGSKGLPRKNLALLGGKPLIVHAVEAAFASRRVDRVVVTTDDAEIAAVARAAGAEVPFLRPSSMAGDRSLVNDAVFHTLERLRREEGYRPTHYAVLYPTSPFRSPELVDRVVEAVLGDFFYATTARGMYVTKGTFTDRDGTPLQPNVTDAWVYQAVGSVQACTALDDELFRDPRRCWRFFQERRRAGERKYLNLYSLVDVSKPEETVDINTPEDLELAERILRGDAAPPVPTRGLRRIVPPVHGFVTFRRDGFSHSPAPSAPLTVLRTFDAAGDVVRSQTNDDDLRPDEVAGFREWGRPSPASESDGWAFFEIAGKWRFDERAMQWFNTEGPEKLIAGRQDFPTVCSADPAASDPWETLRREPCLQS